jgi:hypothetical protein
VDCKVISKKGVETKLLKLTEDRYPAVPKPLTDDWRVVSKKGVETKLLKLIEDR